MEARASSEKAQLLLKNVAERKKQKQAKRQGLVILSATYGDIKAYERGLKRVDEDASNEDDDADLPPPYLDVTIPIQFLVDDFGQLRVYECQAYSVDDFALSFRITQFVILCGSFFLIASMLSYEFLFRAFQFRTRFVWLF